MRRQLLPALLMTVIMTVLLGGVYPLAVWVFGQAVFKGQAEGSLVRNGDAVIGSALLGQGFTEPGYFHPRISAAGADGYDGLASSGSNLGPTNEKYLDGQDDDPETTDLDESFAGVEQRVDAYRKENGLGPDVLVPVDAVTASASGLDPHISLANARLQAGRVAKARGMDPGRVRELIDAAVDARPLGVLGDDGVNVLRLNLSLDGA